MTTKPVLARGPEPQPKRQPHKEPMTAMAWALLAPGSGQLWIGHFWRGMLMFGLAWFCFIGYFWGIADAYFLAQKANRRETYANDDFIRHAQFTLPIVSHGLFWILFVVAVLFGLSYYQQHMLDIYSIH
ncbi:MAG: hypothetical protein P9L99_11445 [Candidatus Lernaella stagnicola]|nr:hypothetical protein [Candidatus Lernaella stagnicola]